VLPDPQPVEPGEVLMVTMVSLCMWIVVYGLMAWLVVEDRIKTRQRRAASEKLQAEVQATLDEATSIMAEAKSIATKYQLDPENDN
jgi:predicted DNA repair protein MutK